MATRSQNIRTHPSKSGGLGLESPILASYAVAKKWATAKITSITAMGKGKLNKCKINFKGKILDATCCHPSLRVGHQVNIIEKPRGVFWATVLQPSWYSRPLADYSAKFPVSTAVEWLLFDTPNYVPDIILMFNRSTGEPEDEESGDEPGVWPPSGQWRVLPQGFPQVTTTTAVTDYEGNTKHIWNKGSLMNVRMMFEHDGVWSKQGMNGYGVDEDIYYPDGFARPGYPSDYYYENFIRVGGLGEWDYYNYTSGHETENLHSLPLEDALLIGEMNPAPHWFEWEDSGSWAYTGDYPEVSNPPKKVVLKVYGGYVSIYQPSAYFAFTDPIIASTYAAGLAASNAVTASLIGLGANVRFTYDQVKDKSYPVSVAVSTSGGNWALQGSSMTHLHGAECHFWNFLEFTLD